MYQLGLQYISITNLTKTCHFMVQFLQNHMKNHREKTLHHLFSHLMASENKILWHTFLYGPKKLQEGFALFFFSFLSPRKETNVHEQCSLNMVLCKCTKVFTQLRQKTSKKMPFLVLMDITLNRQGGEN